MALAPRIFWLLSAASATGGGAGCVYEFNPDWGTEQGFDAAFASELDAAPDLGGDGVGGDAGLMDAGPADAGLVDAGPVDAGPVDAKDARDDAAQYPVCARSPACDDPGVDCEASCTVACSALCEGNQPCARIGECEVACEQCASFYEDAGQPPVTW